MLFYYICSLSLSSLPFFILDYLFMSENSLLARLDGIDARFDEVATLITDPAVIADRERYVRLTKEYHDLERLVMTTRRYRALTDAVNEARAILAAESDEEMRLLAREELDSATDAIPRKSSCSLYPPTRMTRRTLSWKSAGAPAGMRPRCLLPTSSVCIRNSPSQKDGKSLSLLSLRGAPEDIRRLYSLSRAIRSTV